MSLTEHIQRRITQVTSDEGFTRRNERIEDIRSRRFGEHKVAIPKPYQTTATEFRSPDIYDVLRRAPGITTASMPIPKVKPRKSGIQAQENSSLYERWLKEAWLVMDSRSQTFLRLLDALYADGAAVGKIILDRHLWGAAGKKGRREDKEAYLARVKDHRRENFPFFWEHVPTETYYPIYDEDGLAEVLQITERDAYTLAQKYGLMLDGSGKMAKGDASSRYQDFPNTATFIEYWDRDQFCYMVDETVVREPADHGYGRPPFFEAQLNITSSPKTEHQYMGLAAPLIGVSDFKSSFTTMMTNSAYLNAYPTPTYEPTGEFSQMPPDTKLELKIGEGHVSPTGYKLVYIQTPPLGTDLMRAYEWVKQSSDEVALAPILQGILPVEASGTLAMTMITVAKAILNPGLKNLGRMFNEMAGFILEQVETTLAENVPIGEDLELGPDDIKGYYKVTHDLEPIMPAERMQKAVFLADAYQRGAVSMQYYRQEGIGIHDPEQMDEEVMVEKMRESPEYRTTLMQDWLEYYYAKTGKQPPLPQGIGTAPNVPVAPGGFGQSVVPGIQQPLAPGVPMAQRPQGVVASG